MTSTAPGRYNNESKSNINMSDVNTATTIGNSLSDYRGVAGIPSTGPVSFSDLRGVFKTSNYVTNGYAIFTSNISNYYLSSFLGTSPVVSTTTDPGNFADEYFYTRSAGYADYAGPDDTSALTGSWGYWNDPWAGGSHYGFLGNQRGNALTNTRHGALETMAFPGYTLFVGTIDGVERAYGLGMIGQGTINVANMTSTYPSFTAVAFNMTIGNSYLNKWFISDTAGTLRNKFRTSTRTVLNGIWQKTDNSIHLAVLDTAPFINGTAITATNGSAQIYTSGAFAARHINNQISFGFQYETPGANWLQANYGSNIEPIIMYYDVGVRNLRPDTALYKRGYTELVSSTNMVPPFNT